MLQTMDSTRSYYGADRYSAKKMSKPVNFICVAPEAKEVHLLGDFNSWNPTAHPMKRNLMGHGFSRCHCIMGITIIGFWSMANRFLIHGHRELPAIKKEKEFPSSR